MFSTAPHAPQALGWGARALTLKNLPPHLTDGKTEAPWGRELSRGHLGPGYHPGDLPSPFGPGFLAVGPRWTPGHPQTWEAGP